MSLPIIDAKHLEFSWPNADSFKLSVDSLSIAKNEKIFIQGPSGCGKSTLLSLLSGVNLASSGKLKVLGATLGSLSASQRDQFRADHIGLIFQMFNLLPYLTTLENVMLACEFSQSRKKNALKHSSSIEQEAKRLLAHLEIANKNLLNKPVNQLSVGQQQRVAAARALIGSPEIIIADEPTSSLDADRCDAFMNLLLQEANACHSTLIFVSHDKGLTTHFDRALQLKEHNANNASTLVSLSDIEEVG